MYKTYLARRDVELDRYFLLAKHGVTKEYHVDYDDEGEQLRREPIDEIEAFRREGTF